MGILSWIILGLLAGLIAKAIRPGKDPGGWIITIIIGLLGSVVGGWIGSALGWGAVNEFSIRTLLLSTGGAVVVLWIFALLRKK
ncbi:GlsB/YeaQ/YmgE family stress response membrane protein [Bacteroides heparinolyticus]|uniref:GlsB/YeaQ/YmgE family stress response membrane protein n=1 Tax=Prevotella heparinolytica TaxID=28113 RepID=UPI0035A1CABB